MDFFKDCYYINLDRREDRKHQFIERSNTAGISAIRISGITPTEQEYQSRTKQPLNSKYRLNEIGCTLSHQHIIKLAKDNNLENVLVLEDDCVFVKEFKEKATRSIKELASVKWDILYMGGNPEGPATRLTDNLYVTTGRVADTHCIAYNNTIYDTILSIDAFNAYEGIDRILFDQNVTNKFIYLLTPELLAGQDDSSPSDLRYKRPVSMFYETWKWKQAINSV